MNIQHICKSRCWKHWHVHSKRLKPNKCSVNNFKICWCNILQNKIALTNERLMESIADIIAYTINVRSTKTPLSGRLHKSFVTGDTVCSIDLTPFRINCTKLIRGIRKSKSGFRSVETTVAIAVLCNLLTNFLAAVRRFLNALFNGLAQPILIPVDVGSAVINWSEELTVASRWTKKTTTFKLLSTSTSCLLWIRNPFSYFVSLLLCSSNYGY